MCGNNNSAFFELSAVRHRLLLTDTILIGGQRRSVKKIMAYKRQWIDNFWTEPVTHFATRLRSINSSQTPAIQNQSHDYNTFSNFRYIKRRSRDTDSSDTDSSDSDSGDTSMSSASTPTIDEDRAYAYKTFNNSCSSNRRTSDNNHSRTCNII